MVFIELIKYRFIAPQKHTTLIYAITFGFYLFSKGLLLGVPFVYICLNLWTINIIY